MEAREELIALAEAYLAGDLTDADRASLEAHLRGSEEARIFFLSYTGVHAGMAWEYRGAAPSLPAQSPPARFRLPRWSWPVAAAVALGAVWAAGPWRKTHFGVIPAAPLAVVTETLHGRWGDGTEVAVQNGVPAGAGSLQSGLVDLETRTGTHLLIEGPASWEWRDELHLQWFSGNVVVRMRKGESGFVVEAPQMKVTDLGTEFGVSVAAGGEARVQVYDGKVLAKGNEAGRGQELDAGRTVRATVEGQLIDAAFQEDRFLRRFPPPRPGEPAGGSLYSRSALGSVEVMPATHPIAVDADLSEWAAPGSFRAACQQPYGDAYYLEGRMMYDTGHLYLAAHVGDPEPMHNAARSGVEFAGGSVIVRVSTDRKLGWPLRGNSPAARATPPPRPSAKPPKVSPEEHQESLSDQVASIIMWYDAAAARPRISLSYGFNFHGTQNDPPGWVGAFRPDSDGRGYTLEYSIPWSLLHCEENPPVAGDELAALWMVHWSDREGRLSRGQLVEVTNTTTTPAGNVSPPSYFQYGPYWGKARYR